MTVTLAGLGCGARAGLTLQALEAIGRADLILGSPRLLEDLPPHAGQVRAAVRPEDILSQLTCFPWESPCVLYSGDTGFYSGARLLIPLLEEGGIPFRVLPGLSSVQLFAARLARPWQHWRLCSAHGLPCDPVEQVCFGVPAFFLTGGDQGPGQLCAQLTQAGLGELEVTVGENLSLPGERLVTAPAKELSGQVFAPLSVILAQPAPLPPRRCPGLPDEAFVRGSVPMTKREVRCAVLAHLGVGPEDLCWDIGGGTGSVSVELALQARGVWAVEREPQALALMEENRARLKAWRLRVVPGEAPQALSSLPRPDAVFIGGSGGKLRDILAAVHAANPRCRVCVSAVTLETLHAALEGLTALGWQAQAVQLSVSRTRQAGGLHLLQGQNPVFLITGEAP